MAQVPPPPPPLLTALARHFLLSARTVQLVRVFAMFTVQCVY